MGATCPHLTGPWTLELGSRGPCQYLHLTGKERGSDRKATEPGLACPLSPTREAGEWDSLSPLVSGMFISNLGFRGFVVQPCKASAACPALQGAHTAPQCTVSGSASPFARPPWPLQHFHGAPATPQPLQGFPSPSDSPQAGSLTRCRPEVSPFWAPGSSSCFPADDGQALAGWEATICPSTPPCPDRHIPPALPTLL